MAGLVPAIHVFEAIPSPKTWMPATSAGMTNEYCVRLAWLCSPATDFCRHNPKVPHSPYVSRRNANHGGNATIAAPRIKQTAKKISRRIKQMKRAAGIS
jgi:hypothetical protein